MLYVTVILSPVYKFFSDLIITVWSMIVQICGKWFQKECSISFKLIISHYFNIKHNLLKCIWIENSRSFLRWRFSLWLGTINYKHPSQMLILSWMGRVWNVPDATSVYILRLYSMPLRLRLNRPIVRSALLKGVFHAIEDDQIII